MDHRRATTPAYPWDAYDPSGSLLMSPPPSSGGPPGNSEANQWLQSRRAVRDTLGVQNWLAHRDEQMLQRDLARSKKRDSVLEGYDGTKRWDVPTDTHVVSSRGYISQEGGGPPPQLMHVEIGTLMASLMTTQQTTQPSPAPAPETSYARMIQESSSVLGASQRAFAEQKEANDAAEKSLASGGKEDVATMDVQFLRELLASRDTEIARVNQDLEMLSEQGDLRAVARKKTLDDRMNSTRSAVESLSQRMHVMQEDQKVFRATLMGDEASGKEAMLAMLHEQEERFQSELTALSTQLQAEGETHVRDVMRAATLSVKEEEAAVMEGCQRGLSLQREQKLHWMRAEARAHLKEREMELAVELYPGIRQRVAEEVAEAAYAEFSNDTGLRAASAAEAEADVRPGVEREAHHLHDTQLVTLRRRLGDTHRAVVEGMGLEHCVAVNNVERTARDDVERCIVEQLRLIGAQYDSLHGSAEAVAAEVQSKESAIQALERQLDEAHRNAMESVRTEQSVGAHVACDADTLRQAIRLVRQREETWHAARTRGTMSVGVMVTTERPASDKAVLASLRTHKAATEKSLNAVQEELAKLRKLSQRELVLTPESNRGPSATASERDPAARQQPVDSQELYLLREMEKYRKGSIPKSIPKTGGGGVRGQTHSPSGTTCSNVSTPPRGARGNNIPWENTLGGVSTTTKGTATTKKSASGGAGRVPHPLGHVM